jgi:hypothetical protein
MLMSLLPRHAPKINVVDGPGANESKAFVPIAGTEDAKTVISVACRLGEILIFGVTYYEFSFAIVVDRLGQSPGPFETQDPQIAAGYIPKSVRPRVMDVVCDALSALVDHVGPQRLYAVTRESHPPPKCLRKYYMLIRKLQARGYVTVDDGPDSAGRYFCVMKLGAD